MSGVSFLEKLLDGAGIEWQSLERIAKIKHGKDWKGLNSGDVPVYGSGGVMGYVDQCAYDKPTVLIPRKGSITNTFYVDTPFWNVDTIYYTDIDVSKVTPKYLYHFIKTIDLMSLDTGSGRPSLTQAILNNILVPIPCPENPKKSLEIQAEIVRILDAFTALTTELTSELREKSEGGIARPLLVVMEEAHRYLSKEADGPARAMVQRIVKEGRKFGIGAMIVSQRPSEVDETILSQCGTFIALRLSNSADRAKVQASLPDNLAGVVDSLPVLRVGEAIITGEAARLPIRCRITLPDEMNRPNSEDPAVAKRWQGARLPESYERVAAAWRAQNPTWTTLRVLRTPLTPEEIENMDRETVASSTVLSIGYEPSSNTLEVEFKSGVYQYYNVPEPIYQQLMASESKGKFMHTYIKPAYPCSRV